MNIGDQDMRQVKSCGVLVFRSFPVWSFLLLGHPNRYDLPKGHIINGESEQECALRELNEETGIELGNIRLDKNFRYSVNYCAKYKRFGDEIVEKTLVIFIGYIDGLVNIKLSEHQEYEWFEWSPPHKIQEETIDPLLSEVENFFRKTGFDSAKPGFAR